MRCSGHELRPKPRVPEPISAAKRRQDKTQPLVHAGNEATPKRGERTIPAIKLKRGLTPSSSLAFHCVDFRSLTLLPNAQP